MRLLASTSSTATASEIIRDSTTGFCSARHHTPLARAILERLRKEGFAGATVVHGVAGFGANSVIHTASLIELSADLPVVVEIVDDQAHVDRLLPILDEMITGGALVTVEPVRVVRYAAGPRRPNPGSE